MLLLLLLEAQTVGVTAPAAVTARPHADRSCQSLAANIYTAASPHAAATETADMQSHKSSLEGHDT